MEEISTNCKINTTSLKGQTPIDSDVIDDITVPVLRVISRIKEVMESSVLTGGPFDYSGMYTK